jgi:hypothetical protein
MMEDVGNIRAEFVEPLNQIAARVASRSYRQSAGGSGVTPLGLFTIHVWESALTAPDDHTMMEMGGGGVHTFKPQDPMSDEGT